MKRHQSLIALSHDHHQGLMLAQLIKKGAPEYKGLPSDLAGKVAYTKESWEKELKLHFENEENILFPFLKGKEESIDRLIDEILAEHIQINKLIMSLDKKNNHEEILDELGNLIEQHIRKEERQLFQKIQSIFGSELNGLNDKIISVKKSCNI